MTIAIYVDDLAISRDHKEKIARKKEHYVKNLR